MRHRFAFTLAAAASGLAMPAVPAGFPGPMIFSVETAPVREEMLGQTLYVTGDLAPARRALVGSQEEGLVAALHVNEGTAVAAGEPLITLDAETLALQVSEEDAALAAARAELTRLETGSRRAEIVVAQALVRQREAQLADARQEFESQRQLVDEGVVSAMEFSGIEAAYNSARAQLESAEAALALAEEGFRTEEIAAQRARVAEVEARLARARQALDRATVRAPFDCVVTRVLCETGEWMERGGEVAEVLESERLEVIVEVPEARMPQVRAGQPAQITVDPYRGEVFEGEVTAVVPDADLSNRTYPVYVGVDNADGRLLAGMFSRVAIATELAAPTLVIPSDALVDRGRGPEVWKTVPGLDSLTVQPVRVEIGRRRGTEVEILSGLTASDEVVVVGGEMLFPGAQVAAGGPNPMMLGGAPGGGPPAGAAPPSPEAPAP